MPRGARLDLPGLLQHVVVRGSEGQAVFPDGEDREDFVRRFRALLLQTGTECFAWALLPDHLHLLLRTRQTPLATFMRRLLTGYAVSFNLRRRRTGRLFRNRYRSVVCEEEPYLLELVRYIHLHPLRARLVATLSELDRYPWSGHAVLMGLRSLEGQSVEEVLGHFGRDAREARRGYWHFVAAGARLGRRDELVGGGQRRSRARPGRGAELGAHDERVLGSGDFVEALHRRAQLRGRVPLRLSLHALLGRVAAALNLDPGRVLGRSRSPTVTGARSLFCYLAVGRLGYRGTEVGPLLGLTRSGTSKAVQRGRELVRDEPEAFEALLGGAAARPDSGTP